MEDTIVLGISSFLPSAAAQKNKDIVGSDTMNQSASSVCPQDESESSVKDYPGLSYYIQNTPADRIVKNNKLSTETTQVTSFPCSTGLIFTPAALCQNYLNQNAASFNTITDQHADGDANSRNAVIDHTIIKIEPQSNSYSKGAALIQADVPPLPKISSVASIRNSEHIAMDPPLEMCAAVQVKQERLSPTPDVTNGCDTNSVMREGSNVNCSAASALRSDGPHHDTGSHNVAASFPGVIRKVKPTSQRSDPEKVPEVSSSTGTFPSDEQSTLLNNLGHINHPELNSSDNGPLVLIHELLAITKSEEKLVQRAKEAENTIAQLNASLEEWKRKKYEIEQEQMQLRMKRQELLLSAAKGTVPCDKRSSDSFRSASTVDDKSEDETSSDDEQESAASVPSDKVKSTSDSDLSWSESLSRTHHTMSGIKKRKARRRNKRASNGPDKSVLKLRPRRKRELIDEPLSDSSANFSTRSSACKRHNRSFPREDDHFTSDGGPRPSKKKCMDPHVVLQPLALKDCNGSKKFLVKDDDDDDVIVLRESSRCSRESRKKVEDLDSSSDGTETIEDEESVTIQEDAITPSTEPMLDPKVIVNIGALNAHDTAIVDLKVYDGYLYSCSLDCTAKRFSIKDPQNDNVSYEGHTKTVTSISLSPFKEVYTTCHDRYLRCFAPDTGINVCNLEMKSGITCSCDGSGALYLGLVSGEVIFFNFRLKKEVYALNCATCAIGQLATVTQGAQRLLCVAANDGIVSLYDTATGLLLRCLEGRVQPPCCIQICDNSIYITTSEKSVLVHDLLSGKLERMMNWAASATGLEIVGNFILMSSYDGLIRCHDKKQEQVCHSIYYGAEKGMVMCMTTYKDWVFTGNRRGIVEAFKFDPSKQLSCQYGRCRQNYGRECDVLHHVTTDHLPCINMKTKTCPWRTCTYTFTPRTTIEEKKVHLKEHISSIN